MTNRVQYDIINLLNH